ncbi:TrbI/VirB10 family protein [Pseudovibrio sp. Tun.PSC04-5.I4]|uniref:TrbI/VirB10 family protein n=1 Tax=Pseudovibrio sp. Tun.PSC04-5.I4 TaxID=1798213 RepID=UPI000881EA7D|nr:TrbI/VirB10 family protein [Pseudovibrio sp. Tun.PSC04-5.I4]SDR49024.1 type IV secretion system protein VirB10 [Pseudovibrio sp. Tun.PSC04-5.I4]
MALCDLIAWTGLLVGVCATPQDQIPRLPQTDDPGVFDYVAPPKPEPRAVVVTPPIIIRQEVPVEKTVVVKSKPPAPIIKTEYVKVLVQPDPPKVIEPDPYELELQSELMARRGSQTRLGSNGGDFDQAGTKRPALPIPGPTPQDIVPAFLPPAGIDKNNNEYAAPRRLSTSAVDNTRIMGSDRYITGILEGGINSQLSSQGAVVIQVSRPTYGYHGRTILIPRGSRLECSYESADKAGQTRIGFNCHRIRLGESRAEIYQLSATIGDAQGYGGVSGDVDNRWWEKYGSAVMTVGIGAAVESAVTLATQSGGSSGEGKGSAASEAFSGISENIGVLSSHFLQETVDLKPVIRISQGTRVQIRPKYDWYLASPN